MPFPPGLLWPVGRVTRELPGQARQAHGAEVHLGEGAVLGVAPRQGQGEVRNDRGCAAGREELLSGLDLPGEGGHGQAEGGADTDEGDVEARDRRGVAEERWVRGRALASTRDRGAPGPGVGDLGGEPMERRGPALGDGSRAPASRSCFSRCSR